MSDITRKKTFLFIITGIILLIITQLLNRILNANESYDFLIGLLEGLGIGLMIFAIIRGRFKDKTPN